MPLRLLRRRLPGRESPAPGPGPFALSDPDRLAALLETAGFRQASVERMEMATRTEPSVVVQSGPVAAVLREAGQAGERLRPALEAEVAEELKDGIRSVALLVSAIA